MSGKHHHVRGRRFGGKQLGAMFLPVNWALPAESGRSLALAEASAQAALLSGDGSDDDLATLLSACTVAVRAVKLAIKHPKLHLVSADQLPDALEKIHEHARALHSVRDRYDRVGKAGLSGPERSTLSNLCEDLETLRDNLGRRIWVMALRESLENPFVEIPPETAPATQPGGVAR